MTRAATDARQDAILEAALRLRCEAWIARTQADALMQTLSSVGKGARQIGQEYSSLVRESQVQEDQRAELERLNNELNVFAFAIAHDLRVPLVAAQMALQALQPDTPPRRVGEAASAALHGLDDALHRIEGLLVLARTTRTDPARERIDLGRVATEAVERVRHTVDIPLEVDVAPGLEVVANRTLLGIAIENLVMNAALHGRGEACWISVGSLPGVPEVFYVADRGPGIDMEVAEQLFEPFVRTTDGGTPISTGLGLAIARRAIQRMGGQLWHEQRKGGGSRFCFHFSEVVSPTSPGIDASESRTD